MSEPTQVPLTLTRKTVEYNVAIPAVHFIAFVGMLTIEFPELDLTIRGILESEAGADSRIVSMKIRAGDVPRLIEVSRTFCQNVGILTMDDLPG